MFILFRRDENNTITDVKFVANVTEANKLELGWEDALIYADEISRLIRSPALPAVTPGTILDEGYELRCCVTGFCVSCSKLGASCIGK